MNIEKDNLLELFKEKITDSVYPLKMGGLINKQAFDELVTIAGQATILLKEEDLVPKKLLSEIISLPSGSIVKISIIKMIFLHLFLLG